MAGLETAPTVIRRAGARLTARIDAHAGGAARRQVILTLAAALALSAADLAAVGTSSTQLQKGLGIGKGQIGLLLSVTGAVGAVATVPAGRLVDRLTRTRLLRYAVICWAAASVVSALATSFAFLFCTRMALGLLTSVAGPAVASLLGDYIAAEERGRVYGIVLTGELVGSGFGFVVSGELAAISWRLAFAVLAVPAALVWAAIRRLPEPARDGSSQLRHGERNLAAPQAPCGERKPVGRAPEPRPATPNDALRDLPLRAVARYVLSIRTNVVLIVGGSLSYFFLAGVQGFGVEFAKDQYGVGQSLATILVLALGVGGLIGVNIGGRLADRLRKHGRIAARVEVGGLAMAITALFVLPMLFLTTVTLGLVPLLLTGLCQGATNPPLDAARLDVMPPALWGQAEGIRSVAKSAAQALSPVLFGFTASDLFGGSTGLRDTFAIMLVPLAVSGLIVAFVGRRTYPGDEAAAEAARPSSAGR